MFFKKETGKIKNIYGLADNFNLIFKWKIDYADLRIRKKRDQL